MPRHRTALLAREAAGELEAYLRQRALHFATAGNFAIAADYAIRLLNRRPKDPAGLLIGEISAARTNQPVLREKCVAAQQRLCAITQSADAADLITDSNTSLQLRTLRIACAHANHTEQVELLEDISVRESEPLATTQSAVRSMAFSEKEKPLVALLSPRGAADGRGLYATRCIPKGLSLMSDAPFAVCAGGRLDCCAQCLRPLRHAAVPCESCDGAEQYCSGGCRDTAWREHHACACAATNPSFASWTAQMRERSGDGDHINKRAAQESLFVAKLCAMATAREVHPLALPGIAALRGRATYNAETALSEIGAMAVALAASLRQTYLCMEEVLSLFAIVQSNEFLLSRGTTLYYGFSMLNHSCDPNSAIVGTDAARQQLVALRDIREGEQVFINYNANLTENVSYEERRALCQQRHFECFCAKCVRKEHFMLRRFTALLCVPSNVTLTSCLSELASRAASSTTHKDIWTEVESTSHFARSLKETDSLLAIVFRLLRHKGNPPPPPAMWPTLIRNLAPFSGVEANSVLAYPGRPDCPDDEFGDSGTPKARGGALRFSSLSLNEELENEQWWAEAEHPGAPSLLRPTRETLLMTGGVVPLSARAPCSDGAAFGRLLNAFSDAHGINPFDVETLQSVSAAVTEALQWMAAVLDMRESSPLACATIRFIGLLVAVEDHPSLAEDFAARLIRALPVKALGARWLSRFLALHHTEAPDALLCVPLARIAARGLMGRCEVFHAESTCAEDLRHIHSALDVTLQRNANNGNPLGLSQEEESETRLLLTIALLRAMRVQSSATPDAFLRDAVDIVERSPVSLAIEYELLAAKVQLLDLFIDDTESSSAIYDDLLQSLRAIVELRNRDTVEEANAFENNTAGAHKSKADPLNESKSEEKSLHQYQFQEAHRLVVSAFARSHLDERLNQAYTVLVAHKYHGLVITTAIAHPLLDALSKRGDCRVFNIVDLCVLYSGCSIDYETVSYLFRACRVAGDHYRARTLYQLLREMMPGFLLKAPAEVREALRELKVLDLDPAHMCTSVLNSDADELADAVMNDEAMALTGKRQWGPMRDLPTVRANGESTESKTQSSQRHRHYHHTQKKHTASA